MLFPARLSWLLIEQGQARGEREVNAWSQHALPVETLPYLSLDSVLVFIFSILYYSISFLCLGNLKLFKVDYACVGMKKKRKNSHIFQIDVNTTNAQLKTWTINYRYCYDCKIYSLLIQMIYYDILIMYYVDTSNENGKYTLSWKMEVFVDSFALWGNTWKTLLSCYFSIFGFFF